MIIYPGNKCDSNLNADNVSSIPGKPGIIPITNSSGKLDSQFIEQGKGSNLDADTLEGLSPTDLLNWENTINKPSPSITLVGDVNGTVNLLELMSGKLYASVKDNSHKHTVENVTGLQDTLNAKISIDSIIDNLTTVDGKAPLSAKQGKILKDLIDNIKNYIESNAGDIASIQKVVDYVKKNQDTLKALTVSNIAGLQAELDNKVDINRVLTDVPADAVFTDTIYDDTRVNASIDGLKKVAHTHTNKDILDSTSAVFDKHKDKLVSEIPELSRSQSITDSDISKIKNDIQSINKNGAVTSDEIKALNEVSHSHQNKKILDETTESFTHELKDDIIHSVDKLASIENGATSDQTKEDIDNLHIDAKTVNGHSILSDVPADALFTDTIYELNVATINILGGIKSGGDIDVDSKGNVTVKKGAVSIGDIDGLKDSLNSKRDINNTIGINEINDLQSILNHKRNIQDKININEINSLQHVLDTKRGINDVIDINNVADLKQILSEKRDINTQININEITELTHILDNKRNINDKIDIKDVNNLSIVLDNIISDCDTKLHNIKIDDIKNLGNELSKISNGWEDRINNVDYNDIKGLRSILDSKISRSENIDITDINGLSDKLNEKIDKSAKIQIDNIIGLTDKLSKKCEISDLK